MLSIEYHGTAAIALYEAFRRESAISLELIIKAAIAWQIEDGSAASHLVSMPMSHDLPRLWRDARLPPLSRNDARWLLDMKWALLWSSRYPAPKDGAARQRQQVDLLTFERSAQKPKPLIGKMESFGWNDLNRIYSFVEEHRVEGRRD